MSTQLTGASAKILFESPAQLNLKKKLLKEGHFEIVSSGPESATNLDKGITVAVSELADSSVNFVVRAWVKTPDYWDVKFALTETIKLRFDAEGISIPFPQQDVHHYNKI